MDLTANGFVQSQGIDLSGNIFASGIYFIEVRTQEKTHILRLAKQ